MNPQALQQHIRKIAKEKSVSPQVIRSKLQIERFLSRISQSQYNENLIFKGGNLLSYLINLGRETKDIDFLLKKISGERSSIYQIIKAICEIDLNDNYAFHVLEENIKDLEHDHMEYPGFRVKVNCRFANNQNSTDQIQLDIGVGDIATEVQYNLKLLHQEKKGPLFEEEAVLYVYPLEWVFAEKLETVISKGELNSRMKDFFDLYKLIPSLSEVDKSNLIEAINETFLHRKTKLELPLSFKNTDDLFTHWSQFLKRIGKDQKESVPQSLIDVLDRLNEFLDTLFKKPT